MATKFDTKLAVTRLVCEISPRSLRITGGFRGQAIEWCHSNSITTDPCCHGNEIWAKIGYNSACIKDISEILASNRRFSWSGYWTLAVKYYRDRPWLSWQRNLGQNWLSLSLYAKYLRDLGIYQGVFRDWLLNCVSQILPRPTLVAMATKFRSKLAITWLVREICQRFLDPPGGFWGRAI